MELYYKYSDYLKNKFGEKVYKLPINLPVTCPNRDGNISTGGCTYCGEQGAGFECLSEKISVKEQLSKNMDYIKKRYKAEKFIAYFQNYSNTYMPLSDFKKYISEAITENIVDISISTRPDCINNNYLDFLKELREQHNINITLELGLQTANYKTLKKINRGHTLAEYIESTIKIKNYGFDLCTHIILNLPWDTMEDITETAKIVSVTNNTHIKLHALYIVENTEMAKQYLKREFEIISVEEYKNRVITFLEYLSPQISIQRIIGRAPEKDTLFVNWGKSWWKIKEEIEYQMTKENRFQGKFFNYTNGKALRKF